MNLTGHIKPKKCICEDSNFNCCHVYRERPAGETDFRIENYYREIWKCSECDHYRSTTDISLEELYSGKYASMTYGNVDDIRSNFDRIMNLDPKSSDNIGRVSNIKDFVLVLFCYFVYYIFFQSQLRFFQPNIQCCHLDHLQI